MIHISKTVRRSAAIGAGAVLLMGSLAACGSSSDTVASTAAGGTTTGSGADTGSAAPAATATPAPAPAPAPAKLQIKKNAVSPAKLTVTPGEKVQIVNSDSVAHELVDSKDKISSGNIKTDSTGALTAPAKAGTFKLIDPNHSGTKLTLVVS
ncbi:MAG TPA: cupredoxin domain-containing protein [Sporichthyaceae bacterium]|jgi:plastocyanin|nr:cupredoxin domain-containing protein [Sporichthyaceae bacterium]